MYNYFDLGLRIFYKKKYIEKAYIFFTSIFFFIQPMAKYKSNCWLLFNLGTPYILFFQIPVVKV